MLEVINKPDLIRITRESGIPLVGNVFIGCIDRGSNTLQVRATTLCNMNCIFCSTDGGPFSKHKTNYIADVDYLTDLVKGILEFKGDGITIFLDSVGEPTMHPDFVKLVKNIKKIKQVSEIITITNGALLTKNIVDSLEKAGLTRINLSLHSLNPEKSKILFGMPSYGIERILEIIDYIAKSRIDLLITPVYLPNVNDEDIENLIRFCKEKGYKMGIQKFDIYRYGRKPKGVKLQNWWKFYKQIEKWENIFGMRLKVDTSKAEKRPSIPLKFKVGEKIYAEIKMPGWIKNQAVAVANNRCITIENCNKTEGLVKTRITENKNNIYLAELA